MAHLHEPNSLLVSRFSQVLSVAMQRLDFVQKPLLGCVTDGRSAAFICVDLHADAPCARCTVTHILRLADEDGRVLTSSQAFKDVVRMLWDIEVGCAF